MSQPRHRKLSAGLTRRPPLGRSNSDISPLNDTQTSCEQSALETSRNHSKSQNYSRDKSEYEKIEDSTPETSFVRDQEEEENSSEYSDDVSASDREDEESNYDEKSQQIDFDTGHFPYTPENIQINTDLAEETVDTSLSFFWYIIYALGFFIILSVVGFLQGSEDLDNKVDIELIKQTFPTQNEELWMSFEAGVQDVLKFNKPSTFILLYQEDTEQTVTNLVDQLSKYAACYVTQCSKVPIKLTNAELNSPEVVRNYGSLIEKYRNELENRGVMVVKNLEKTRGVSAQAFHTFCDEHTPLVEKSVFIFTLKVDELPGYSNKMKFLEDYFNKKWNDVKTDIRVALITRITSMVLEVQV